jgi:hypothetical protein
LRGWKPLFLLAACSLVPAGADADWRLFLPRRVESGASIEASAAREDDDATNRAGRLQWSDNFLRQKLTLFTNGYVYHPRFLQYRVALSGALKQERYDSTFFGPGERKDSRGFEYEARVALLPEHRYHLELFAVRFEPLYREMYATRRDSVQKSWGADFGYRKDPYFFRSRYAENLATAGNQTSRSDRLNVDGGFFRQVEGGRTLALRGAFSPSRFENSSGLDGQAMDGSLDSLVMAGDWRLDSTLTGFTLEQRSGRSDRFTSDQFVWLERLTWHLPLHLRTDLSYRYQQNESRHARAVLPANRARLAKGQDVDFALVHKLYESLDSTYLLRYGTRTSPGGESTNLAHSLGFTYSKKVPRGRLQANLGLQQGATENRGRIEVANEARQAALVPGSFLLGQPDVDPAGVVVSLRSPLAPFELVQLDEGLHYGVSVVGNLLEINVFALPPRFAVPGTYDFSVSYGLAIGEVDYRFSGLSHGATLELFNNLLVPYYSYSENSSRVVSGAFAGQSPDTATWAVGLSSAWRGWRARVEHRRVDWEISPYDLWREEAGYIGSLGPATRLSTSVSHQRRRFPRGRSLGGRDQARDDSSTASATLQQYLFARRLVLAAGGSYTEQRGLSDAEAYSLNTSASLKIGRLDLTGSAAMHDAETRGGPALTSRRVHHYYYLTVRRRMF